MKRVTDFEFVYLHREAIDFRKGLFSLSAYIQGAMKKNPFDGSLFVFSNKRRTAVKIVYWDQSGFSLWMKVLEKEKFVWPKKLKHDDIVITPTQLEWLLNGLDILKMKPHKEIHYDRCI